jgi:hypothetical protein
MKTHVHEKTHVHRNLFIKAIKWKQPKCPLTDEWVYSYNGMLFSN